MKLLFILVSTTCAIVLGTMYFKKIRNENMYRYSTNYNLPTRPFPTELLVEVKNVSAMETKAPLVKSPSLINTNYTKKVECTDLKDSSAVGIVMTDSDIEKLDGLKNGDVIAAFGLEKSKHVVFRVIKYSGKKNTASIQSWYEALK